MKPITICLDFGNTRRKCAVFEGSDIAEVFVLETGSKAEISAILQRYQPHHSILSSVIEHEDDLIALLEKRTCFHLLDYRSNLPFTTPVSKPATIGADRLALAAAAVHFYPRQNNLVIGMGSCITYNFINQYHQFLGGGISPGKKMRFRSMHEFTAKLPLADSSHDFPLIGYDTVTNLQSGVMMGMAAEMDGIIGKYAEKFGNFNVVLTGGDLAYFESQVKRKIFADANFLFKGLYAISQVNTAAT